MSGSSTASEHENNEVSVLARRRLVLYDEQTRRLLRQAYELAKQEDEEKKRLHQQTYGDNTIPVLPKKPSEAARFSVEHHQDDDAGEILLGENGDHALSTIVSESESDVGDESDSDENNDNETNDDAQVPPPTATTLDSSAKPVGKPGKTPKPSGKQQKRTVQDINRHADNLIRIDLPLPPPSDDNNNENDNDNGNGKASNEDNGNEHCHIHLFPAAALLPKNLVREPVFVSDQAQTVLSLSEHLSSASSGLVVVLLVQSGRFAGGIFRHGRCLAHRATARYTVRKGQGKAQSAQDGSRRPKSVGSQLRRAGEEQLNEDVKSTLMEWHEKGYTNKACLIFLACPKTMGSTIFSPSDSNNTKTKNKNKNNADFMLSKDDDRIRKIPFDVGRATFHNAQVVYEVMMGVDLCHVRNTVQTSIEEGVDGSNEVLSSTKTTEQSAKIDPEEEKRKRKEELELDLPMTPLHSAARDGNLTVLLDLLNKNQNNNDDSLDVDQPAGYDCMTPLHFAAAASAKVDPVTASALVTALLVQAHSDPSVVDASGRPPYFLAKHDKIREAFRKARAILGEEYCDWDGGAKVGPPLTEDDLEAKKEKEREKKRRQKARQKEKKAKARAAAQEAEKTRVTEEETKKAAEEAKRVRDGLSAKPTGPNVCDFCGKVCKGRNASKNMFRRLDYKYCSTECVTKHKRELMAAAAMARFGGY
mmetsp:Transcript_20486/g.42788  ORF Transcript_20486/g.42788 Transcript_20486/m.42788 type:complete len:702 (+) Transcript_20486:149-2254(+)|eukprot:CAMPEP_0201117804 /NCGR_PEP_ID=MMETSP0850-20130426/1841_1 /ASSEMBLY_ACC=CAM_ASM_000622 /TAXON_ID=183588 /ORGANISM="Pseudo-nitzschia fraudulenta, Strain WWA7" /LENGTH=701 /DNA_ID=CAMNT_0047382459 /DNA_START=191 /DNA_END=2296 /DNA_ORIENTATION=-